MSQMVPPVVESGTAKSGMKKSDSNSTPKDRNNFYLFFNKTSGNNFYIWRKNEIMSDIFII